jgi:carbamoyl-phosphate synthase small subunit
VRANKKRISDNKTTVARSPGDFFEQKIGSLKLEDGVKIQAAVSEWFKEPISGEVVFNTGMTGYVETLTDPSYAGQILVFTYPLIGNYGVHEDNWESKKVYARAVIVENLIEGWSHPKSHESISQWLKKQNVPILSGVDTRELTQHLRTKGTMKGILQTDFSNNEVFDTELPFITIGEPKIYNEGAKKKVILLDCGAKENIARSLVKRGLCVKRVPYDYDFSNEDYDGVVLSNGPGDPNDYKQSIDIVAKCLEGNKAVFGICLGSQLMSLAAGAKTYKLKFGHRGHNQPCMDETDKKCYITSQNHGYAIEEKSLPKDWKVLFRNLNDKSVEGIYHSSKPFFSVQFHPESAPGPTDTEYLFDKFVSSL